MDFLNNEIHPRPMETLSNGCKFEGSLNDIFIKRGVSVIAFAYKFGNIMVSTTHFSLLRCYISLCILFYTNLLFINI